MIAFLATSAVLAVAVWVSPDARGHGTHEQLGLPACRWVADFGLPCPTCGMTTAFALAVRGDFVGAFVAQPFGFLLAILTGCALLVGLYVAGTGSNMTALLGRVWGVKMAWGGVALLLLAWAYKILEFREIL